LGVGALRGGSEKEVQAGGGTKATTLTSSRSCQRKTLQEGREKNVATEPEKKKNESLSRSVKGNLNLGSILGMGQHKNERKRRVASCRRESIT